MARRITRYLVLAALGFLVACSDQNDLLLVGEWEGTRFTTSVPVDENLDGVKNTDLKLEMSCISMEAVFSSAGKFILHSTDPTYDVQVVNGQVVLTPTGCNLLTETGRWRLNEETLQLHLDFDAQGNNNRAALDVEIELSETLLVLKNLFYSDEDELITFSVEFRSK